jgi:hypothetical protein
MTTKRTRTSNAIAKQSAELAFAVPQVIAHRLTRMALSGPVLSSRDQKEFHDMVAEKQAAFRQAWSAMAKESIRANQAMAMSMFGALLNPFAQAKHPASKLATDMQTAAMGVFSKGLAPVHKKAVSNAKRLSRTRLRP